MTNAEAYHAQIRQFADSPRPGMYLLMAVAWDDNLGRTRLLVPKGLRDFLQAQTDLVPALAAGFYQALASLLEGEGERISQDPDRETLDA